MNKYKFCSKTCRRSVLYSSNKLISAEEPVKTEPKTDVKQEKVDEKQTTSSIKPPPEKKPKLIR